MKCEKNGDNGKLHYQLIATLSGSNVVGYTLDFNKYIEYKFVAITNTGSVLSASYMTDDLEISTSGIVVGAQIYKTTDFLSCWINRTQNNILGQSYVSENGTINQKHTIKIYAK